MLMEFINDPYKFVKLHPKTNMKYLLLPISWVFQGLLYADITERNFKILIDVILTINFYIIISKYIENVSAFLLAFSIAHTINWLFNTSFWAPFRGRYGFFINGLIISPKEDHIIDLRERIKKQRCIQCAAVYGSIARAENNELSDLDVRIIRKSGIVNGFQACTFGFLERTRAFFERFPLDLYVIDNLNQIYKIRSDEKPIILYDPDDVLKDYTLEPRNV